MASNLDAGIFFDCIRLDAGDRRSDAVFIASGMARRFKQAGPVAGWPDPFCRAEFNAERLAVDLLD